MVKRKSKAKRRTSKQKGVSLIGLAETYMLMNVATQAAFKTNPVTFLTSKGLSGSHSITLQELFNKNRFYDKPDMAGVQGVGYYIGTNLKTNGFMAALQMALIPVAFRLGRKLANPAIRRTNKLLADGGIANTVKV